MYEIALFPMWRFMCCMYGVRAVFEAQGGIFKAKSINSHPFITLRSNTLIPSHPSLNPPSKHPQPKRFQSPFPPPHTLRTPPFPASTAQNPPRPSSRFIEPPHPSLPHLQSSLLGRTSTNQEPFQTGGLKKTATCVFFK